MTKNIKMTEAVFRKQVRNVVKEALQTLLEADGERLPFAKIDPRDLMDDEDDAPVAPPKDSKNISVHKAGAPIAKLNAADFMDDDEDAAPAPAAKFVPAPIDPRDLMDDEEDDFGYPAPKSGGSLADKFNDMGDEEDEIDPEVSPVEPDARKEWLRQRLVAKAPVTVKNGHYWRLGKDLGPVSDDYKESAESIAAHKKASAETAEKFALMTPEERKAARATSKAKKKVFTGGNFEDVAEPEEELKGSIMDRVEDLADKTGLTGEVGPDGKPLKKTRDANGGLNAKLEDIGAAMGFTKENARQILKAAMDGLEQHAPALSDLTDEEGNPMEGPEGTISYQDMPDIVFDAWDAYKKSLKKAGLSDIELKQMEDAVKKDPINMLVGHNHYLDDEQGKARVNSALRSGKISRSEAELMIAAIDKLPPGDSYDWNALRRSGIMGSPEAIADLKNLIKTGVWNALSGKPLVNTAGKPIGDEHGKPVLDPKTGKPIAKPFQMDDEQEDEEFRNFRWHLVRALESFKEENGIVPPSVARDAAKKAVKKAN